MYNSVFIIFSIHVLSAKSVKVRVRRKDTCMENSKRDYMLSNPGKTLKIEQIIESNLYITVTLGKWPGDRYIQGDLYTQVSFKLPQKSINSIFMCKQSLNLRLIDNNE